MALLFTLTSFLAAFLLFSVQPLVTRLLLPPLGGSPMVWNTAQVFFQGALLAGYFYAHAIGRRLDRSRRVLLIGHFLFLLLPLAVLPIAIAPGTVLPANAQPILWVVSTLVVVVGAPFLLVSTCSPLLQRLYALTGRPDAGDPYFLYAASNAGSFGALLAYPVLIEPTLGLRMQGRAWTLGYVLLVFLLGACSLVVGRRPPEPLREGAGVAEPIAWSRRLRWLLLSLAPSSLMLSVTTHLSTSLVAIPLLWIVPLSLYLLSFVVVFSARRRFDLHVATRVLALALPQLVFLMASGVNEPMGPIAAAHVGVFFVAALVCHGALAQDRPPPAQLTEFFGWMALGGVLGGSLNALLAPLVFTDAYEYPLTLGLVCVLMPRAEGQDSSQRTRVLDVILPIGLAALCGVAIRLLRSEAWSSTGVGAMVLFGLPVVVAMAWSRRPVRFGLAIVGILFVATTYRRGDEELVARRRSFFGIHTVKVSTDHKFHLLWHGATLHGVQRIDRRDEPLVYYSRIGPVGDVMRSLAGRGGLRVAAVGLGGGALAAYAQPGQSWTFYEIDPHVAEIASNPTYFSYLHDAPVTPTLILGDARVKLRDAADGAADVLVLDAYSSDTIPVHLLTREAMQLYLQKLAPGGVLVCHISNNWFDLEPILGRLGQELGLRSRVRFMEHVPEEAAANHVTPAQWVVLARAEPDLGELAVNPGWRALRTDAPLWTDDASSLWPLLVARARR